MKLLRSLFKKAAVVKNDAAWFLRLNGDITLCLLIVASGVFAVILRML
jgi:hypothetical protein